MLNLDQISPLINFCIKQHVTFSWVIWSTSVTVERKGRFFSGFVFYEG